MNIKRITLDKAAVFLFVLLACFGQPNSIYLVFPPFSALFMLSLVLMAAYFVMAANYKFDRGLLRTGINIPLALLFILASFSTLYSLDPLFSIRSLASSLVKPTMFFLLMISSFRVQMNLVIAGSIKWTAVFFSVTGILLFLSIVIFGIKPLFEIGSVEIGGGLTYEEKLSFYGILGFMRSYTNFLDIVFPRVQSFFAEPGYFGFFLELSIFSTLYYKCVMEYKNTKVRFGFWVIFLQLIALCLSLSLGAIISVSIGAIISLWCAKKINFRKIVKSIFAIIFIVLALVSTSDGDIVENPLVKILVTERFNVTYGSSSVDTRMNVFNEGFNLIREKPLLGWGFGQVRIAMNGSGANNSFVTVFAELGIIGLLIYIYLIYSVFNTLKKTMRLSQSLGSKMINSTAALTGMMGALTLHTFLIDSSWTFIYWLGISLIFLHQRYVILAYNNKHCLGNFE